MGAVVVQDEVDVQPEGNRVVDLVQEFSELDGAVAAMEQPMTAVATSSAANSEVVPWRM